MLPRCIMTCKDSLGIEKSIIILIVSRKCHLILTLNNERVALKLMLSPPLRKTSIEPGSLLEQRRVTLASTSTEEKSNCTQRYMRVSRWEKLALLLIWLLGALSLFVKVGVHQELYNFNLSASQVLLFCLFVVR